MTNIRGGAAQWAQRFEKSHGSMEYKTTGGEAPSHAAATSTGKASTYTHEGMRRDHDHDHSKRRCARINPIWIRTRCSRAWASYRLGGTQVLFAANPGRLGEDLSRLVRVSRETFRIACRADALPDEERIDDAGLGESR